MRRNQLHCLILYEEVLQSSKCTLFFFLSHALSEQFTFFGLLFFFSFWASEFV